MKLRSGDEPYGTHHRRFRMSRRAFRLASEFEAGHDDDKKWRGRLTSASSSRNRTQGWLYTL